MKNVFFLKIFKEEREKGVSLYMTIILMAVLLSMVLGVTSIIVNGLNIAKGVTDSVKAFHAADTGIEEALYRIRIESSSSSPCSSPAICDPSWGDPANWYYTFTDYTCDLVTPSISIKCKGVYYGSQRMIEVRYGD